MPLHRPRQVGPTGAAWGPSAVGPGWPHLCTESLPPVASVILLGGSHLHQSAAPTQCGGSLAHRWRLLPAPHSPQKTLVHST